MYTEAGHLKENDYTLLLVILFVVKEGVYFYFWRVERSYEREVIGTEV